MCVSFFSTLFYSLSLLSPLQSQLWIEGEKEKKKTGNSEGMKTRPHGEKQTWRGRHEGRGGRRMCVDSWYVRHSLGHEERDTPATHTPSLGSWSGSCRGAWTRTRTHHHPDLSTKPHQGEGELGYGASKCPSKLHEDDWGVFCQCLI